MGWGGGGRERCLVHVAHVFFRRLEEETMRLRAHITELNREKVLSEQRIRDTLVESFEKQQMEARELADRRFKSIREMYNEQVSATGVEIARAEIPLTITFRSGRRCSFGIWKTRIGVCARDCAASRKRATTRRSSMSGMTAATPTAATLTPRKTSMTAEAPER